MSRVRIPPEAAHFSSGKRAALNCSWLALLCLSDRCVHTHVASYASGDRLTSRPKDHSQPRELWFSIYSCSLSSAQCTYVIFFLCVSPLSLLQSLGLWCAISMTFHAPYPPPRHSPLAATSPCPSPELPPGPWLPWE